jgi:hypothetical protein
MCCLLFAVCGNGICENSEQCIDAACSTPGACLVDCPFPIIVCPAPILNAPVCSGHGVCLITSGVCDCFGGYAGAACDQCDTGYAVYNPVSGCVMVSSISCVSVSASGRASGSSYRIILVFTLLLQIPHPSCTDDVKNGLEDDLDCGRTCESACPISWAIPPVCHAHPCLMLNVCCLIDVAHLQPPRSSYSAVTKLIPLIATVAGIVFVSLSAMGCMYAWRHFERKAGMNSRYARRAKKESEVAKKGEELKKVTFHDNEEEDEEEAAERRKREAEMLALQQANEVERKRLDAIAAKRDAKLSKEQRKQQKELERVEERKKQLALEAEEVCLHLMSDLQLPVLLASAAVVFQLHKNTVLAYVLMHYYCLLSSGCCSA